MERICPEDRPISAIPSEMESVEDTIRRLLPTPAPPPLQAAPKYTDRDTIVRQLMETICPEDRPTLAILSEMESVDDTIRRLLSTPAPPPLQAAPKYTDGPEIYRQGHSGTATEGKDLPNNASGTETTADERLGSDVIQSVPSENSHGGVLHGRVLFMRGMDT